MREGSSFFHAWISSFPASFTEETMFSPISILGSFVKYCLHAKSLQLCLTLCNSTDCSPPGFSVHGIPQARILKWIAMTSSRGSSQPRGWTKISLMSPALAGRFFNTSDTLETLIHFLIFIFNWFIAFYEIYNFLNMLIISQNCDFPKKYLKKKKFYHMCYGNKKNSNIK